MKKRIIAVMAVLFLGLSTAWAQTDAPVAKHRRQHTRPPYSGPMKPADKVRWHRLPLPPPTGKN